MENWSTKNFFLYLLTCSIVLSALMGIWALISGDFGETQGRILGTTCTVVVASIFGLACGAFLEKPESRNLPIFAVPVLGITLTSLSALIVLWLIWFAPGLGGEWIFRVLFTTVAFGFSFSQLSLLSLAPLAARFKWALTLAFASSLSLTAISSLIVLSEISSDGGIMMRVLGILAVVDAAATVMIPIFYRLSRTEAISPHSSSVAGIDAEITELRTAISRLEKQKEDILNSSNGHE